MSTVVFVFEPTLKETSDYVTHLPCFDEHWPLSQFVLMSNILRTLCDSFCHRSARVSLLMAIVIWEVIRLLLRLSVSVFVQVESIMWHKCSSKGCRHMKTQSASLRLEARPYLMLLVNTKAQIKTYTNCICMCECVQKVLMLYKEHVCLRKEDILALPWRIKRSHSHGKARVLKRTANPREEAIICVLGPNACLRLPLSTTAEGWAQHKQAPRSEQLWQRSHK